MAASVSCGGGAENSTAPGNEPNEEPPASLPATIAFVSDRDGNSEIYVLDAAGERRLTDNPGPDENPVWSPDASRIAFERDGALWAIRVDGTGLMRLTNPPAGARDLRLNGIPLASSDGRLLYSRHTPGAATTLRVINFDGANDREVTAGEVPTWSANGSLVAFNAFGGGSSDVHLIRDDGTQRRNLTNTPAGHEDWPVVSPDGQQVAFASSIDGIVIMRTDGTSRTAIAQWANVYSWSPDGKRLAFRAIRAGSASFFDVWVINADGSGARRLTNMNLFVGYIRWSPDGTRIAFDNGLSPGGHLYVVNADGSGFARLTPLTSSDYQPAWKP